jgi:hypothetical protein
MDLSPIDPAVAWRLIHGHEKGALILGVAGALWMVFVLYSKSLSLALFSNYPGAFAARWVQYRGIGPSAGTIFAFNIWLVVTEAHNVRIDRGYRPSNNHCDNKNSPNSRGRHGKEIVVLIT